MRGWKASPAAKTAGAAGRRGRLSVSDEGRDEGRGDGVDRGAARLYEVHFQKVVRWG
jgi:hypothetical protein